MSILLSNQVGSINSSLIGSPVSLCITIESLSSSIWSHTISMYSSFVNILNGLF